MPEKNLLSPNISTEQTYQLLKTANIKACNENGNALHAVALGAYDRKERFRVLLQAKVDPNYQEPHFHNTPLHTLIANELSEDAVNFIDAVIQTKSAYNYCAIDINGRTPLLLAVLFNKKMVVEKILSLKHEKEIGVNQADHAGKTPLHYACALGYVELTKQIIAAGANLEAKDRSGKTPLEATTCSENEMRELFQSIEVDPERAENADFNYVRDQNDQFLQFFDIKEKKIQKINILAIKNTDNQKQLGIAIRKDLIDNVAVLKTGKPADLTKNDKNLIIRKFSQLSSTSLIQACLSNQLKTQELLLQQEAKPEGLLRIYQETSNETAAARVKEILLTQNLGTTAFFSELTTDSNQHGQCSKQPSSSMAN